MGLEFWGFGFSVWALRVLGFRDLGFRVRCSISLVPAHNYGDSAALLLFGAAKVLYRPKVFGPEPTKCSRSHFLIFIKMNAIFLESFGLRSWSWFWFI